MDRLAVTLVALGLLGCTPGRSATNPIDEPVVVDFRFAEVASGSNDPFFGEGAAETAIALAPGEAAALEGAIDARDGNETYGDSDGFTITLRERTQIQAELRHAAGGGVWAVAIHHADRRPAAWWGMSDGERALTHPIELPAGEYFVHVSSEAPGPDEPIPYTVTVRTGDLGACESRASADHVEGLADNDHVAVRWASFPTVAPTSSPVETTGLSIAAGAARVIEGRSDAVDTTDDSYLDRDAYAIEVGDGVTELRVRLEHASADVNMDVLLLSDDGAALVGTGITIGDSPEVAAFPVAPGGRYLLWIGARDERAIGGDTALPLDYRAVVCGRGP